ncbi:MAG: aminopeptidase N [Kiritimatiellia bacterium]
MACFSFMMDSVVLGGAVRFGGATMPFAEPGVQPNYGPSRTVRIEHIGLSLTMDPIQKIHSGRAAVRFTVLPTHTGTVQFDLDDVVVDTVTSEDGEALEWSHDDDTLNVRGVAESGTVVVTWRSNVVTRGMYFTGPEAWAPERQKMAWTQCQDEDAHFIFPCHDHPSAKHAWSIELRGPAGYTLLSNGAEVDNGEDERGAWARFEQAEPMPAYLFSAVAAKLSMVETEWRGRPVRYLVPVGEEEAVLRAFGKTTIMMEHYSQITGVDFPWPRYDQVVVHDFIFGGMENTAVTTMTDLLLVDEAASLEWDPDRLVCHELAHQWFGDLLTCQDWSQGYLNESWATFMEVVWWEHDRSVVDATWYKFGQAQWYLGEDGGRYRRPIISYDFREPIDVFDRHLYEKGACVFNTLRSELGADAFWAGCKLYLDRHRFGTVHSRHFQRAMEDASGRNLDRFFHQWIHGAGHPDLNVTLAQEDGLLTVAIKQTQSGEQTADAFHFSLAVEVVLTSGERVSLVLPVRERERSWAIPVSGEVSTVRVDAGFHVLATIKLSAPRAWLIRLANDECPVLSVRAHKALLDDGSAKAMDTVVQAGLGHDAWQVRVHTLGLLSATKAPEAKSALLTALTDDEDPRVQRAAADGLGVFRDEIVASALIDRIDAGGLTPHLHGSLLMALGRTRDARAVSTIREQQMTPSWASIVTSRGLQGLAYTQDPEVLDDLLQYSTGAYDGRVRSAAAMGLGILGDAVDACRDRCVERLGEMLNEPGFRAQLTAMSAMGVVRDPRSLPALARVHSSAPDGRSRRMAYEAMVKVRAGRTSTAGLGTLQARLDALVEQNHKLRRRIDKLERQ